MATTQSIGDDASRVRRSAKDNDTKRLAEAVEELAKNVSELEETVATLQGENSSLRFKVAKLIDAQES